MRHEQVDRREDLRLSRSMIIVHLKGSRATSRTRITDGEHQESAAPLLDISRSATGCESSQRLYRQKINLLDIWT